MRIPHSFGLRIWNASGFCARKPTCVRSLSTRIQPWSDRVSVKAFYVSHDINLKTAAQEVYGKCQPNFQRDCVIIRNPLNETVSAADTGGLTAVPASVLKHNHVVLFNYGSVVFFNFSESEQKDHLRQLRKHFINGVSDDEQHSEDHTLAICPSLPTASKQETSGITVIRALNLNELIVISAVMGQTVVLDHHAAVVEDLMAKFTELNTSVEKTGMFTMNKKKLFRLVAKNSSVFSGIIVRLRFLDRSDTAWKDSDSSMVWDELREEFELESRFKNLEFKVDFIQRGCKFFLEVIHNQKSHLLELTIIVLISAEIVVGLCDLFDYKPFAQAAAVAEQLTKGD